MSQAAKAILGFGALLSVVLATDYPAYNLLAFSDKCGERTLSTYAHEAFRQGLFLLSFSMMAAVACIAIIPAGIMALKADHHYTREKLTALHNSLIRNCIITVLFVASDVLAYAGWDRAASFFDGSTSVEVLKRGDCTSLAPSAGRAGATQ